MDKVADYQKHIKNNEVKPKVFYNSIKAFIFGGSICVAGEIIKMIYMNSFNLDKDNASTLMIVTIVLVTALLTGIGIFDKFGQIAGAGSFVPITGFANSMTSAALEAKSEGIILGIAAQMFKLAGSVITLGVVSAYVIGIIRYFFNI